MHGRLNSTPDRDFIIQSRSQLVKRRNSGIELLPTSIGSVQSSPRRPTTRYISVDGDDDGERTDCRLQDGRPVKPQFMCLPLRNGQEGISPSPSSDLYNHLGSSGEPPIPPFKPLACCDALNTAHVPVNGCTNGSIGTTSSSSSQSTAAEHDQPSADCLQSDHDETDLIDKVVESLYAKKRFLRQQLTSEKQKFQRLCCEESLITGVWPPADLNLVNSDTVAAGNRSSGGQGQSRMGQLANRFRRQVSRRSKSAHVGASPDEGTKSPTLTMPDSSGPSRLRRFWQRLNRQTQPATPTDWSVEPEENPIADQNSERRTRGSSVPPRSTDDRSRSDNASRQLDRHKPTSSSFNQGQVKMDSRFGDSNIHASIHINTMADRAVVTGTKSSFDCVRKSNIYQTGDIIRPKLSDPFPVNRDNEHQSFSPIWLRVNPMHNKHDDRVPITDHWPIDSPDQLGPNDRDSSDYSSLPGRSKASSRHRNRTRRVTDYNIVYSPHNNENRQETDLDATLTPPPLPPRQVGQHWRGSDSRKGTAVNPSLMLPLNSRRQRVHKSIRELTIDQPKVSSRSTRPGLRLPVVVRDWRVDTNRLTASDRAWNISNNNITSTGSTANRQPIPQPPLHSHNLDFSARPDNSDSSGTAFFYYNCSQMPQSDSGRLIHNHNQSVPDPDTFHRHYPARSVLHNGYEVLPFNVKSNACSTNHQTVGTTVGQNSTAKLCLDLTKPSLLTSRQTRLTDRQGHLIKSNPTGHTDPCGSTIITNPIIQSSQGHLTTTAIGGNKPCSIHITKKFNSADISSGIASRASGGKSAPTSHLRHAASDNTNPMLIPSPSQCSQALRESLQGWELTSTQLMTPDGGHYQSSMPGDSIGRSTASGLPCMAVRTPTPTARGLTESTIQQMLSSPTNNSSSLEQEIRSFLTQPTKNAKRHFISKDLNAQHKF